MSYYYIIILYRYVYCTGYCCKRTRPRRLGGTSSRYFRTHNIIMIKIINYITSGERVFFSYLFIILFFFPPQHDQMFSGVWRALDRSSSPESDAAVCACTAAYAVQI